MSVRNRLISELYVALTLLTDAVRAGSQKMA